MGNELAEGSVGRVNEDTWFCSRMYTTHTRNEGKHGIVVVLVVVVVVVVVVVFILFLLRLAGEDSSLFPLSGCLEVRECSGSARFSRSPWVG